MDRTRWQRARQLFDELAELESTERDVRLRETCGNDAELRREVESLLAHDRPSRDTIGRMVVAAAREATHEAPQQAAQLPSTIGRYRVLSRLGAGGMGEVFLAEDPSLGRKVALKLPAAPLARQTDVRARLRQEARAAAPLNHPHVCVVHEVGEGPEGRPFIAMEYVEGETLAQRLRRGPLSADEVVELGLQATGALEAAHSRGIVHRDLKPSNIMLTVHGIKLLDFGLASAAPEAPEATSAGGLLGTIPYMSPEQARCENLDHRSDLFSLGVVLYEAATGRLPFDGSTPRAVRQATLTAEPLPPTSIVPTLPPGIDHMAARALAKERALRYQTAAELRDDLAGLAASRRTETARGATHAAQPSRGRRGALAYIAAGAAAAALAYFQLARPGGPQPSDPDTVLLGEIVNTTGDPAFDGTLREALLVQLRQTPFLNVLAEASTRDTLRAMTRPADARLTDDVAQEICRRRGLKAWIAGSIEPLGRGYAITLVARNGAVLARERRLAESKVRVLPTLGAAALGLRQRLGESLPSVRRFDTPIERATTRSLDALKAYAIGAEQAHQGNYAVAVALFQRSVQVDPEFAIAHLALARERLNSGYPQQAVAEAAARAFELRDRATEQEKLSIVAFYHSSVTGDMVRAIEAGQAWRRTYPLDWRPHHVLADLYHSTAEYGKAAEAAGEAVRLNPDVAAAHSNLGGALFALDRFGEAREVYRQAMARRLDAPEYHAFLWRIAYYTDDAEAMEQQLDWAAASSGWAFHVPALAAALQGRWREARRLSERATAFFEARGMGGFAAMTARYDAVTGSLVGDCATSRQRAVVTLALAERAEERARAATALALCGGAARALEVADRLRQGRPHDTMLNGVWLPLIRAAAALAGGRPGQAIEALRATTAHEGAAESWPIYMRGLAYLRAGDGARAAAEFQKVADRRGRAFWFPFHPLAHLGLARAAALRGDTGAADQAYRTFFALWKDADPDLPVLVEARVEYDRIVGDSAIPGTSPSAQAVPALPPQRSLEDRVSAAVFLPPRPHR